MTTQSAPRRDVLVVFDDENLGARVSAALDSWEVGHLCLAEDEALRLVASGLAQVVVCQRRAGVRLLADRVLARGGRPIVFGSSDCDPLGEREQAERLSDLAKLLFQGTPSVAPPARDDAQVNLFAQAVARQFTLPGLMQVVITKTRQLCEADGASLVLADRTTGELYFDVVEGGGGGVMERMRLERGKGIASAVAKDARPRLVASVSDCRDFDSSLDHRTGFRTGSIVAVPLVVAGDVLGVLMGVRAVGALPFKQRHLEQLVQLAPHVAIAVHNAQVTTALRAAQAETLEANERLEQKVTQRTALVVRAKQEWERTFDVIAEPIAVLDGFVIRRANQAYALAVGRSVKELPGLTCHRVLAGSDTPCSGCPVARGRDTMLTAQLEVDVGGTERRLLRFSGYWMSENRADTSVVVHYQDITQAKVLADRLRESERSAALGQLASGAAHEINNPLGFVMSNLNSLREVLVEMNGVVRALADAKMLGTQSRTEELLALLLNTPEPELENMSDALAMVSESLEGAGRVADIVKGLRQMSRLEIGGREKTSVDAAITRVVRAEFGDAPLPNVVLELVSAAYAEIPPLQLDQALSQLLKNARQATQGGQRLVIRSESVAGDVVVQVQDEGPGIKQEHVNRVFEPFFTTRGVGGGIGLGLTAAYSIIKRAGGDIEAASAGPGKGAVFTVRLPRVHAPPAAR